MGCSNRKISPETSGHTQAVNSVAFSQKGDQLASASDDKTVHIWDAATGGSLWVLEGHEDLVNSVAFSPTHHQLLASASDDKCVYIWDVATGAALQRLEGHTQLVNSVTFSHEIGRAHV